MNRNIKATYDGKHFLLTAEGCNTVELLSFACDVVEQALHIVAGNDTELFDEAKEAIIEEIQGINEVHYERLVQGVIVPVPSVQIQEVEELSETSRGVGGFGSTGK